MGTIAGFCDFVGGIIFRTQVQVMQEEGGGSFWATFGGGTNGAEVASCGCYEKFWWFDTKNWTQPTKKMTQPT